MTTSDNYMDRAETASVDGPAQMYAMLAIAAAIREQTEAIREQNDLLSQQNDILVILARVGIVGSRR